LDFAEKLLQHRIIHFGQRVENVGVEIVLRPLLRILHQLRHSDRLVVGPREQRARQQKCEHAPEAIHGANGIIADFSASHR
jgi:hypothetical protein